MDIQSHKKFCHFTSAENAKNILSSGSFFLNKYKNMNDLAEAGLHGNERDRVFVLCFSNSDALNIPAFYLYGGIDGRGCRIQFTAAKIKEIISSCSVSFVGKKCNALKKEVDPSEYTIYYDWIHYIASNGYCEYKNEKLPSQTDFNAALAQLQKQHKHYFIKSPIWKYENEFRIVVVFKKDISYDRIALRFNIKKKDRGISIMYGPETTKSEYEEWSRIFRNYGITNNQMTTNLQISMKLISRNKGLLKK